MVTLSGAAIIAALPEYKNKQ